jgi:hypothetical protein
MVRRQERVVGLIEAEIAALISVQYVLAWASSTTNSLQGRSATYIMHSETLE